MSVADERGALDHPVTLLEHARRLHRLAPDRPLPGGGRPFPDGGDPPQASSKVRRSALVALLREFLADAALSASDLHDRCRALAVFEMDVLPAVQEIAPDLPSRSPRILAAARWLLENGTDRRAVLVGMGLLHGGVEEHDIPTIRMIGLLCFAEGLAVQMLARTPGAERDLMWLAERSRSIARTSAVQELAGKLDPEVRHWVLATPRTLLSSELARRIAERYRLAEELVGPDVDDELWERAGNVLLAMSCTNNYRSETARYEQARRAYEYWVAGAAQRPPTLERAALLTMIAEDLLTGPAAPVVGDGRRALADTAYGVLRSQPWSGMLHALARGGDPVEARRAAWVLTTVARDEDLERRFAVRIVVSDPLPEGFPQVEARVLIDGMPVVATAFDKGPAEQPERLVDGGRLRAAQEPKEVRLAEAYCTEGCCGGLYVTIVREGEEVVWKDWRSSMRGGAPGEVRFDAAEYDREVERAEQDHGWEWPARTVARLVDEGLSADPTILSRWDCAPGWCTAWLKDYDSARLTFTYPARRGGAADDPMVQFGLVVDVGDRAPEVVAAEIVESWRSTDPKTVAEMIGGNGAGAAALGIVYRRPSRW